MFESIRHHKVLTFKPGSGTNNLEISFRDKNKDLTKVITDETTIQNFVISEAGTISCFLLHVTIFVILMESKITKLTYWILLETQQQKFIPNATFDHFLLIHI